MKKIFGVIPLALFGSSILLSQTLKSDSKNFTPSILVGAKDQVGNYLLNKNSSKINSSFVTNNGLNVSDTNDIEIQNNSSSYIDWFAIFGLSLIGDQNSAILQLPFWNNFNSMFKANQNFFKLTSKTVYNQWTNSFITVQPIPYNKANPHSAIKSVNINIIKENITYNFDLSLNPTTGFSWVYAPKNNNYALTSNLNLTYNETNKAEITVPLTVIQNIYFDPTLNKFVNIYQGNSVNTELFSNVAIIQATNSNASTYDSSYRELNIIYVNYLDSLDTPWEDKAILVSIICGSIVIVGTTLFFIGKKQLLMKKNKQKRKLVFINQSNALIANDLQNEKSKHKHE